MSVCGGDAPDTSGINAAAVQSAAISQDALNWFKQAYASQAPARDAAAARDNAVADAQVRGMNFATDEAQRASERQRTVQQPLEDRIISDANAYDTPARRAEEAARSAATVESSAGRAQADLNREIMRRGGTVGSPDSQALMEDAALRKAGMTAQATDQAVRNVEQQGYARKLDAASLMRNLPATQATQEQIAATTGNTAVGASNAALGAVQSGNQTMNQGFDIGLRGMGQSGALYGQAAGIDSASRGQDMALLGSVFGSAMKPSSKKVKKNRRPTDDDAALAEVNSLPVDDYEYDPAKGGPAGQGPQTGPMAEDVRKKMGDRAAPGGKMIDYSMTGMGGKIIAAVQALSRRVDDLQPAKA